SRKLKSRWLLLAVVVVLLLAIAPKVQQYYAVVAVQASLKRNWEIHWAAFDVEERPTCLPEAVDAAARRLFNRMDESGRRAPLMQDRFRVLFGGSITDIHIYDPEDITGDLGAALLRFPKLQRVAVTDNSYDDFPMEASFRLLCTRLRELSRLEELALDGHELTTASLAPLAGHPTLQKLRLPYSRITPDIIQVLAAMPSLKEVEIGDVVDESKSWESPALQARMRAALPGVTVTFIK
ncbi:MAG: hypothetical protein ACAH88_15075, partial [Roseimicrobium sp.]